MPISFQQIPSTIHVPYTYVEFDGTGARRTASGKPQTIMALGQMSAAKSVSNPTGSTVPQNIPRLVRSATEASTFFGASSQLAHMADCLFKSSGQTPVYMTGQLDDAAGVARVMSVNYTSVYTAAAAVAGIEKLYIADKEYRAAVAIGDTAATVATAIAAAITADAMALFTAVAAAGVVTLTAKNKGAVANDYQVVSVYADTDVSPSGTFVTPTQTTAGAGNPSVSAAIAAFAGMDITHVINPYNDDSNYLLLLADAQDRWAPLPGATSLGGGQKDYVVFQAVRGTPSQLIAHMSDHNSEYFTTVAVEPSITQGGVLYAGARSASYQFAAAYAGLSSQLVAVVANNPHQNRALSCLIGAPLVARFGFNDLNNVAREGMSIFNYNGSGQVNLLSGYTERTTTDSGAPTDAERRVETQFAKSYMRWSVISMLEQRAPYMRLADDGTAGLPQNVVTPSIVKGWLIALAKQWVGLGVVEDLKGFIDSIVVERSTEDCNTIKFQISPDIVNVLAVKAGKISYIVC
jgi:phage tail sheath gpL-like